MQSPREALECYPVMVQFSESKESELEMYFDHFVFWDKIKGVVIYILEFRTSESWTSESFEWLALVNLCSWSTQTWP